MKKLLLKMFFTLIPFQIMAQDSQKDGISQAKLYANEKTKAGYLKALSELQFCQESDEVYFLRGWVAAHLAEGPFIEIAEKSFLEVLKSYPGSPFAPKSRQALGVLYYEQKKYRESAELLSQVNTPEALLWLSYSVSEPKEPLEMLYTTFPDSEYAPEAYFHVYPFDDYLSLKSEAIEHLSSFEEKFPASKYTILSNYLLGFDSKRKNALETAADFFEKAERIPTEEAYFKEIALNASLERALVLFEMGRLSDSSLILKRLIATDLFQAAAYHLVNIYLIENQDDEAEKVIIDMLKRYEESKIETGYFISRLWYDRGRIALKENSPRQALNYFKHAELAAKGDLLDENQLLDLWMKESDCHLELGEMDKAMLILSKVANYNAASSLRIKAMYMRAAIYEKQGRYELAKKQLQATSKKGGEWALKAKQKLEKEYVLQYTSG